MDKQLRTMHAYGLVCGKRAREDIVPYFHQLFQKIERTSSEAWDGLAYSLR